MNNNTNILLALGLALLVTTFQEIDWLINKKHFALITVVFALALIPLLRYNFGLALLFSSLYIVIWCLQIIKTPMTDPSSKPRR
jgi:hypothetical protein